MPLVQLMVPSHTPPQMAHALAHAVHHALVRTCRVPMEDQFLLIQRIAQDDWLFHPHFPNVTRSAAACLVHITLLAGRTADQKRALYAAIAQGATASGMRPDDVMVCLTENAAMDWSLGLGQAYADASSTCMGA